MSKVIAIANQKGGVAKTTTAISMGAGLTERGFKVLLIDVDDSGNPSLSKGLGITEPQKSLTDLMLFRILQRDIIEELQSVIVRHQEGMDIIPADHTLPGITDALNGVQDEGRKRGILREIVDRVKGDYDYVLLDAAPALNLMSINVLTAADEVIITTQPQGASEEGILELLQVAMQVRANMNPELIVRGLLITMLDVRTNYNKDKAMKMANGYTELGMKVFTTRIPRAVSASGKKVAVNRLHPSKQNHFRVEDDEAMEELIASIQLKGILDPLLVRPSKELDGYEILSGHRRRYAAIRAGLQVIPVIIMEASDEDRDIILSDSNLQRPYIRISEKAWAIRLKYDVIKRKQGRHENRGEKRTPGGLFSSAERIAEKMGISKSTIKNYLRLTYLIQPFLEMVDGGTLPLKAGVQISYLAEPMQYHVLNVGEMENIRINETLAQKLRTSLSDTATLDDVVLLLNSGKNSRTQLPKKIGIKVDRDIQQTYFPKDYSEQEMQDLLITLLDTWAREHNPEYQSGISKTP
jgi:cellulose biosynthesis protein BcsQ